MKKHIIFIFLSLMSATVLAQEYRLSGKITDDQNQPLMGATILVKIRIELRLVILMESMN